MSTCPQCQAVLSGSRDRCPSCGAEIATRHPTVRPATDASWFGFDEGETEAGIGGATGSGRRFQPGHLLGRRYRIIDLLGRGGMGEVYRAEDLELREDVALKFLPPLLASDWRALDRLRAEVRTARKVSHPNVCRIHDIGTTGDEWYLSMELVTGEDLSSVLRRLGRPAAEKAAEIAQQLTRGLAAIHGAGVLHRDLKPSNVMIDDAGRVRITDFGIASLVDREAGDFAGTPAYMAPELFEGAPASVRSDLYALGLILRELFSDARGDSAPTARAAEAPARLTLDPEIDGVLRACLAAEPERRPKSALAVLALLPGGDPIAAALAAGETPSAAMVADSGADGVLLPGQVARLLAVVILGTSSSLLFSSWPRVLPDHDPARFRAEAERVLEAAGFAELPPHQAGGFVAAKPETADEGGLAIAAWCRWSATPLEPENIHQIGANLGDPPEELPGSMITLLNRDLELRKLDVYVPDDFDARDDGRVEDRLAAVLAAANLRRDELRPVEPVLRIPLRHDRRLAFATTKAGGPRVEVALYGDRVVGFRYGKMAGERWLTWDRFGARADDAPPRRRGFDFGGLVRVVIAVLALILAWRNLKARRIDPRGARLAALIPFSGYLVAHLVAIQVDESGVLGILDSLLLGRALGHAALHAITCAVSFMAIEPHLRRFWPRSLVGWTRLAAGRWRDPMVGREFLIGMATAIGVVGLFHLAGLVLPAWIMFRPAEWNGALQSLGGQGLKLQQLSLDPATAIIWVLMLATVFVGLRLLFRRKLPAEILAALLPVILYLSVEARGVPAGEFAAGVVLRLVYFATFTFLLSRVGFIAAIGAVLGLQLTRSWPLTSDLGHWYAPGSLIALLVIAGLASWSARRALAGAPLFGSRPGGA
ncbi:MAG: serine/threonine protein kinase [Planctomycetes bacterium]|nr:serine/threonine protein kinase [Planctomycetota bacterium]